MLTFSATSSTPSKPSLPAPRFYGDTTIDHGASAVLGDVINHHHYYIKELDLLHDILSRCHATEFAAPDYTHVLTQLDSLSQVLQQAAVLELESDTDDIGLTNTLKALTGSISSRLGEYHVKICNAQNEVAELGKDQFVSSQAHSSGGNTKSMDRDVGDLQQYLTLQMLCINGVLQLMQYNTSRRAAERDRNAQERLSTKFSLQTKTLKSLEQGLQPLRSETRRGQHMLARLSRQSSNNTKALVRMQQAITRQPVSSMGDCINLSDALGRQFRLPFTFFDHWQAGLPGTEHVKLADKLQIFEQFIKAKFDPSTIPGGHNVSQGNFIISRTGTSSGALTKANWASMVYPGCELSMTIVFIILKLSLVSCPRPGCGRTASQSADDGHYITCPKCNLTYRFDRNVDLPSGADEEHIVRQKQQAEDVQRFGQRFIPETIAFGQSQDDQQDIGAGGLGLDGLYPHRDSAYLEEPPAYTTTMPTSIDWNTGATGLDAWLNSSAMPMDEPLPSGGDEYELMSLQRDREMQDLKSLQKIHFVELAQGTQPLQQSIPHYESMSVESQVYLRKIADKFPALPIDLAMRFASSSVMRKSRLKGLRKFDSLGPPASFQRHSRLQDAVETASVGSRRPRLEDHELEARNLGDGIKRSRIAI